MGKTKLTGILMHLEPEMAEALNVLAKRSGILRSVLMREAIADLLQKHGARPAEKPPSKIVRFKTRNMLAADRLFDDLAKSLGKKNFAEIESEVEFAKALKAKRARKKKRPNRVK